MKHKLITTIVVCSALFVLGSPCVNGQSIDDIDVRNVMTALNAQYAQPALEAPNDWWLREVAQSQRSVPTQLPVSLHDLLYLALQHSAQIKVYSEVPLIRETGIDEANAIFDWVKFAETVWDDIDEPVGSALTVGGAGTRFRDHDLGFNTGVRRRTWTGAEVDITGELGFQDSNSNFFVPSDQATTRLSLGFTQPLLRGRGRVYNESLSVLATIDVATANLEFSRQLQSHLLEIARGYWALYLERALLAQKVKLYLRTQIIFNELNARQAIDAGRSQLIIAQAALENRRSELIRSQAAVKNAETRLRALINAPELGNADEVELIPSEPPSFTPYATDLLVEIETAVQNRPEIGAAMKEIKAGSVRLGMAKNEIMPMLNLVTRTYLNGLRGDFDAGQAFVDQFSTGAPSYSVGLLYELPIGNRASRARLNRRRIEARQLQEQYRSALETVNAEVEIAVRELRTAFGEITAKQRSLLAANAEAETIQARWERVVGGEGTASLNLEALLRAQVRVTDSEHELVSAQLTYNLALANLRRTNGTLLKFENIQIDDVCSPGGIKETILDMQAENYIDESSIAATVEKIEPPLKPLIETPRSTLAKISVPKVAENIRPSHQNHQPYNQAPEKIPVSASHNNSVDGQDSTKSVLRTMSYFFIEDPVSELSKEDGQSKQADFETESQNR